MAFIKKSYLFISKYSLKACFIDNFATEKRKIDSFNAHYSRLHKVKANINC